MQILVCFANNLLLLNHTVNWKRIIVHQLDTNICVITSFGPKYNKPRILSHFSINSKMSNVTKFDSGYFNSLYSLAQRVHMAYLVWNIQYKKPWCWSTILLIDAWHAYNKKFCYKDNQFNLVKAWQTKQVNLFHVV